MQGFWIVTNSTDSVNSNDIHANVSYRFNWPSGTLDFWDSSEEVIYTDKDGELLKKLK